MELTWKVLLAIVGVATLTLRTLLDSEFGTTTLVYILVPFLISLALAFFTRFSKRRNFLSRYLNHLRLATIVFFATSVILFEGFICVLMFMPIYYLFVSLGFLFAWLLRDKSKDGIEGEDTNYNNVFKVSAIPVLVLLLVSEGLFSATTVPRSGTATFVADSPLTIAQLQANMAKPIAFESERNWFLKLFPMPERIKAGTLNAGDVHELGFTYRRWVFTNTQRGEMHVKIDKVSPEHIRTSIIRNDSYLNNYMRIDGTDVRFTPKPSGGTRVALTVRYDRLLDPAWYFGPMQHHASKQSAKLFLSDIIMRHPVTEVSDGQ